MKKIPAIIFAAAAVLFSGCNKGITVSESPGTGYGNGTGFTLTATTGGAPDTKLGFDSDGLGMMWQPGDELYLVDVAGINNTVTLTTDITAPAKTASFSSSESVLKGDYLVLYGGSETSFYHEYSAEKDLSSLQSQIKLYGALSVAEGQTSGRITLSHVFARLTFKLQNAPTGLYDLTCGMAVTTGGLPFTHSGSISTDGWHPNPNGEQYFAIRSFSFIYGEDAFVLVPPADLSTKKVFFYVHGYSEGKYYTYEFNKNGINIQAGVNYNITLDCSNANCTSILSSDSPLLSKPEDFRAQAYISMMHSYQDCSVGNDVDFDGEVFFPMNINSLDGDGHTLRNINIDLQDCDNVGLVMRGNASNLNIRNAKIKGANYVGGIAGIGSATNCSFEGEVTGNKYVGGLAGSTTRAKTTFDQCSFSGTVTAGSDYVGGIVGKNNYDKLTISKCAVYGTVSGAGDYAGGICGSNISTTSDYSIIDKCFVVGNVSGNDYVGGICGSCNIARNSYILGNVTASPGKTCGGITGAHREVKNCYSYGTVSSGFGISGQKKVWWSDSVLSNCLTSSGSLYNESTGDEEFCNFGPGKTFLSSLSVINGEEAYSTQVWSNVNAGCPLLQWQAESFGGDISAPGFDDVNW